MSSVRMSAINGCLEREGLARLTISILIITTAGCLAYTWGYAEVNVSVLHSLHCCLLLMPRMHGLQHADEL